MKIHIHDFSHLFNFFLKWEIFQTKVTEKIENTILRSVTFSFSAFENRTVYELMRKKIFVQRGRPQISIWHMRTAFWIPKATNTHSDCVILFGFQLHCTGTPPCYVIVHCLFCYYWFTYRHCPPHRLCLALRVGCTCACTGMSWGALTFYV